jgi:phosphate/phosphite/phosphonate ABC transporter binding protein
VTAWKHKLELKILGLAIALPLLGVLLISAGVFVLLRSGLVEVAEERSESTARIINRSIERVMVSGRADIMAKMVEDLRQMTGVEQLDVINGEGRKAFAKGSPPEESEAVRRLSETGEPFAVRQGDQLTFYRPLLNGGECVGCHDAGLKLLGATKVTVSLGDLLGKGSSLILSAFLWSLMGVALMGLFLWYLVRRMVVTPVRRIQEAARSLAEGDLTVTAKVSSGDEIGQLWKSLEESFRSLGGVITRIHGVTDRVAKVSDKVEKESKEVVRFTGVEVESFGNIAVSMEQFKASIGEITTGLADLNAAAETAHSASQEMATNITEIARNAEELSSTVDGASSTTGEMSHTIRELSWGAEHLSEVATQTLSAVEAVEKKIRDVEEDARESAASSEKVRDEAEGLGMEAVRRTLSGMEQIQESVQEASGFVNSLEGRSREIGKILNVIDEVTDQTYLLALNAAILAAQAGEDGKGFQVVAAEIRKLAVRTAESTVEIGEVIRNVQAEVKGAVESMRKGLERVESGFGYARESGSALEKIASSSRISREKASSIQDSAAEQSEGLAQVKEAMERLGQMTQFLAQGTAEQKREADSIFRAAEQIVEAVNHIKGATREQLEAGEHIRGAVESVSNGTRQMTRALRDEKEGYGQIMESLTKVIDLPGETRKLAVKINQGLRGILSDTELLGAEVKSFKVLSGRDSGTLKLGIVPLESPAEMFRRFSPLAAYLGRLLGRTVELKVALDFAEAIEDLGEGRTQVAYLTPSTYVMARDRHGAVLLAKALRNGEPYQHSVIITAGDSGIGSVEDIAGRSFAFGDPNSTSSHIVPRAMLLDAGISLDKLAYSDYLGHHDDVARAVRVGDYDAGAVMRSVALQSDGLIVVATSPPIPEFNFCCSPGLKEGERDILRQALLSLTKDSEEGRQILSALFRDYTGFATAVDGDYEGVRKMMVNLGLLGSEGSAGQPPAETDEPTKTPKEAVPS